MHTSILQVLKLNEPRAWNMDGRSGMSHSAECLLLNDDWTVDQVGVLKIRGEELIAKTKVGIYTASFAMRANPSSRVIEAVLTDLTPLPPPPGQQPAVKPAAKA